MTDVGGAVVDLLDAGRPRRIGSVHESSATMASTLLFERFGELLAGPREHLDAVVLEWIVRG